MFGLVSTSVSVISLSMEIGKVLLKRKIKKEILDNTITLMDYLDSWKDLHTFLHYIIDDFNMKEAKTKTLYEMLTKLPVKGRRVMILLSKDEKGIKKASDNLENAKTYKADSVNAQAAINCPSIVLSEKGLKEFIETH